MGLRLHHKWNFPVQSPFLVKKSPFLTSCYLIRVKETTFDSVRASSALLSMINGEGVATAHGHTLRACVCTSPVQTVDNSPLELEEIKVLNDGDSSTSSRSSRAGSTSDFSLLIENLDVLEETISDINILDLEQDILAQLGKLGALRLFHSCLSRTLEASSSLDVYDVPTLYTEESQNQDPADYTSDKFIRSGRKEERKLRRERSMLNVNKNTTLIFPKKTLLKSPGRPRVLSAKTTSSLRRKKSAIARNEAEMSNGVKMVEKLEKIREAVEKEIGRAATFSCWAEAAGIDKKVLKQQLRYGWQCRDELVRSTRSLVIYVAKNYWGNGVSYEDLLQAGFVGVLQGANRFDPTRGYKFSTYVQYWIRKSMSTLVGRHGKGVSVPPSLGRAIVHIQKARQSLASKCGKYPVDDEIAKLTGLSLAKIKLASNCLRVVGSIDRKVGENLSVKYAELLPDTSIESPEETVMQEHKRHDLNKLLHGLDSKEREVLALRYGLIDRRISSLSEIGKSFDVSKEWVRKIERKALSKLRNVENCSSLSYYLKQ